MDTDPGRRTVNRQKWEDTYMDLPFRIEKRDSFRVVGSLIETTNKKGGGRKDIPMHWSEFKEDNWKRHC